MFKKCLLTLLIFGTTFLFNIMPVHAAKMHKVRIDPIDTGEVINIRITISAKIDVNKSIKIVAPIGGLNSKEIAEAVCQNIDKADLFCEVVNDAFKITRTSNKEDSDFWIKLTFPNGIPNGVKFLGNIFTKKNEIGFAMLSFPENTIASGGILSFGLNNSFVSRIVTRSGESIADILERLEMDLKDSGLNIKKTDTMISLLSDSNKEIFLFIDDESLSSSCNCIFDTTPFPRSTMIFVGSLGIILVGFLILEKIVEIVPYTR